MVRAARGRRRTRRVLGLGHHQEAVTVVRAKSNYRQVRLTITEVIGQDWLVTLASKGRNDDWTGGHLIDQWVVPASEALSTPEACIRAAVLSAAERHLLPMPGDQD